MKLIELLDRLFKRRQDEKLRRFFIDHPEESIRVTRDTYGDPFGLSFFHKHCGYRMLKVYEDYHTDTKSVTHTIFCCLECRYHTA